MLAQIFGSEQALLFSGNRCEIDGTGRRWFGERRGASEFEQNSATGRVVDSAVINIVAGHRRIDSQMVVVRCIYHSLVRASRVSSRKLCDDIPGDKRPKLADYMGLETNGKLNGLELARLGLLKHFVDIGPRHRGKLLGNLELNPGSCLQLGGIVAPQMRALGSMRISWNLPSVAGEISAMNNQRGDSAAPGAFFVLVSPPAVISEGFALEKLRVVGVWFVD